MPTSSVARQALGCAAIALLATGGPARAQVTTDGTLGSAPAGAVLPGLDPLGQAADYLISPDLGEQVGGNLYHSFGEFSIGVGEVATFTGPDPVGGAQSVHNVVSRVTGGSLSDIDGTLRSTIDGAALYLLNPAGVSFGETAHLDVPGSFHASTADVLRFGDGLDFDAVDTGSAPLLSIDHPSAFGFTRPDPGLISVSRTQDLSVPEGQTLSLIGGFDSSFPNLAGVQIISNPLVGENIRAPGATVQLAAARPGIDLPVDLASLDMAAVDPGDLGNVVLQNSAWVDVSTPFGGNTPAGSVVIRGERFVMQSFAQVSTRNASDATRGGGIDVAMIESVELRDGSQITTFARGEAASGDIRLDADAVSVGGGSQLNSFVTAGGTGGAIELVATNVDLGDRGEINSRALAGGGAGGSIQLVATDVDLTGGGRIRSEASSEGDGGAIDIRAESLRISNAENDPVGTFVSTNTLSTADTAGDAGALTIEVANLELTHGGQVFARTSGAGDAGTLGVVATDRVRLSGVDGEGRPSGITSRALEGATGQGGRISVDSPVVEVLNGAQVASDTFGAGAAGDVDVRVGDRLIIAGGDNGVSVVSAASFEQAGSPDLLGPGGDIRIHGGTILLSNGGQVSASTSGTGDAGAIHIDAARVEISGAADPTGFNPSGIFSQSLTRGVVGGGTGGDIAVDALGDIELSKGGRISARSDGFGDAGSVFAGAGGAVRVTDGAQITTQADIASGGKIAIKASDLVYLLESDVTTSVNLGEGGGGDIDIDPPIVLLNRSNVKAEAFEGPGGNLNITADVFFQSADSVLSASSELGIDGIIAIEATETDLSADLSRLPAEFLDASALLRNPCAARSAGAGSFVVQRQGPLRASPDAALAPVGAGGLAAVAAPPAACPRREEIR